MDFKNLFKKEAKQENSIECSPSIIYTSLDSQIAIGQWLNLLPNQKEEKENDGVLTSDIKSEELLKNIFLSHKKSDKISRQFSQVLQLIGIDKDETCILTLLDENNVGNGKTTFNCHLNDAEENGLISLEHNLCHGNIISFDDGKTIKSYKYWTDSALTPMILEHSITLKNAENGNTVTQYFDGNSSSFELKRENDIISLVINNDQQLNSRTHIDNEDNLCNCLLDMTLPINIEEAYSRIMPVVDLRQFSHVLLCTKKIEPHSIVETNSITIDKGNIESITITRDNGVIAIDKENNWTYEKEHVSIECYNGIINYNTSFKDEDYPVNSQLQTRIHEFMSIKPIVEQVKQLKKTL